MSGQKLNVLLLLMMMMILCCLTELITCKKIMIIRDTLTDVTCDLPCNNPACPGLNVRSEILNDNDWNFCTMDVNPNSFSMGYCNLSTNTHTFNISSNKGQYEVLMNYSGKGIHMWFLQNRSECLPSNCNHLRGLASTNPRSTNSQRDGTLTSPSTNCRPTTQSQSRGCLNILNVDPEENCTKGVYDSRACIGKEENEYILNFNGSGWTCVTCTDKRSTSSTLNPTTESTSTSITPYTTDITTTSLTSHLITNITTASLTPDTTATLNPVKTVNKPDMMVNVTAPAISPDGTIDPSKASEALNKLTSLLDDIKNSNKSNAGIAMGDIIGVIQIQDKDTESKSIDICYSPQQNLINVVESNQNTDFPWSVNIPSEAFDKSSLQNNGSGFVGVLRYTNMGKKDETRGYTILNNEAYGITMGANISNLTNNIGLTIKFNTMVGNVSCTSWDGNGNLEWTKFGCETKKINNYTIMCLCSHLTFFAVLMSVPDANAVAPYLESLTFISSIGCGISVFFLAIALFMHFLLRKAKSNQATKILINLLAALFLLNVSFLSNESVANSGDKNACVFIALLMHYSMLTTFTWFFIQALHMYLWLIRQNVTITNYMRKIIVLGWGFSMPIVVTVVSIGEYKAVTLNSTSRIPAQMCWITDPLIQYIVNIGFYSLVFLFTTVTFIIIVTRIIQSRHIRATEGKRQTFRKRLMMVLSLFLLLGLTWAVAFFSYGPMLIPAYYIFCVLNSLQGFFLFLYYYHIHSDVEGNFSDDPECSNTTASIVKLGNAEENNHN